MTDQPSCRKNRVDTVLDAERDIRRLVEGWVVWRDSGHWEKLRSAWHEDGYMSTTMGMSTVDQFVAAAQRAALAGADIQHSLGGIAIDIKNDRAIAQSKACISQRAMVDGVLCEAQALGRFIDFFAYCGDRWGIVLRQPIYERDRLITVHPGETLVIENELLLQFPVGYQYLAYLQLKNGMDVKNNLPSTGNKNIAFVEALSKRWLEGEALALSHDLVFMELPG